MNKKLYEYGFTQNRELSWLKFNSRVLQEAQEDIPLLEKFKFVAIHSSNLDEFFQVRVGRLYSLKKKNSIDLKSSYTAKEQLELIYRESRKEIEKREKIYQKLCKQWPNAKKYSNCSKEEKKYLKQYFNDNFLPFLNPRIVDIAHPFPKLQSQAVYLSALMKYKNEYVFAYLPLPRNVKDIVMLADKKHFVHSEDIILNLFPSLFKNVKVIEKLKFRLIRSADVDPEAEEFEDIYDYRQKMSKVLKERKRNTIVRVDIDHQPSALLRRYLFQQWKIEENIVFEYKMPFILNYVYSLNELYPEDKSLFYPEYKPKLSINFDYSKPLFSQIQAKDKLLMYPYESIEPFLLLIKEAANDKDVSSIQITLYRLAKQSRLIESLCAAAENGKEVNVLIELKARFDEQNNIDYSQRLEDSGVNVYYGFEHYKVHSKLCLITKVVNNKQSSIALIGTGNFNEKTASQYTDIAYLTANSGIINDCRNFFRNMSIGNLEGAYKQLLVAPKEMENKLLSLIDKEANKGINGYIGIKINSLTDNKLIYALQQASLKGCKVEMVVRGICCLLPNIAGKTENIEIHSIVGRYLEHSRIYIFGSKRSQKVYISSADFMTRNMENRVEVATPIKDKEIADYLVNYFNLCLKDNVGGRILKSNGKYTYLKQEENFALQDYMMKTTKESKQQLPKPKQRKIVKAFKTKLKKN